MNEEKNIPHEGGLASCEVLFRRGATCFSEVGIISVMNDPRKPKGLIRHSWLVVPTLLVASMLSSIPLNNGLSNLYTYEAQAFLHGKLDIEGDISKLPGEIVIHDERLYVAFPPFPAIILLPFVATFGTENIKITLIAAVIGVISCYILYKILNLLELDPFSTLWVLCAFALGTAYWHTLRASEGIWTFAQIVSVCFVLLAIHETLRDGYVPLAGLFLGFAFLSRQLSIYTAIFITAILWENSERQQRLARILVFLFAFGACVLAYILFNYSRFGAIESGYATMIVDEGFGKERLSHYGLFSTAYLTFNSIYMFVQGFHLEFGGADKLQITGLDPYGTSLIAASPFVFAALRARWGQLKLWGGWLSIGLALLHMLLYYNNGFIQLNAQRFTLDFMPVLILLVALGLKNSSDDLSKFIKGLIVYAVVLNALVFILFG